MGMPPNKNELLQSGEKSQTKFAGYSGIRPRKLGICLAFEKVQLAALDLLLDKSQLYLANQF
jgi:hypothetical protein